MSGENVEVVREIYRDWAVGDYSSTDWAAPDIEFVSRGPDAIEPSRGIEAMGRSWRQWLAHWDDFRAVAREFIPVGDAVLVRHEFHGRGKTSGASIDSMPGASTFWFRDGKVVRLVLYTHPAEALEEVGLTAQATHRGGPDHSCPAP